MFEELLAPDVLSNPEKINGLKGKYVILFDQAGYGEGFPIMDEAVNIMVKKGWKCIDVIILRGETVIMVHALMERI